MSDVTVSDRSMPRLALSWALFLALLSLVAVATETRVTVATHSQQIVSMQTDVKAAAAKAATSDDIVRLEGRIIRIESLLLQQQPRGGRGP
jgi:hypothetical protein